MNSTSAQKTAESVAAVPQPGAPAIELTFRVTSELVQLFAEVSSDRNALHLNSEVARKFRYREPVAHGMLAFSYLSFLGSLFPGRELFFNKLAGNFREPIFPGMEVKLAFSLQAIGEDRYTFLALWKSTAGDKDLITSTGEFLLQTPTEGGLPATGKCFVQDKFGENTHSLADLAGRSDHFSFTIAKELARAYQRSLLQSIDQPLQQEAEVSNPAFHSILLLSTLVGMKLPGRYATFVSFDVSVLHPLRWGNKYTLQGTVEKLFQASSRISLGVKVIDDSQVLAEGSCNVIVNPAPRQSLSCEEIKAAHLGMGLAGKVALIIGASRGIGEVTAKLFSLQGAKVAVHYFKGKEDANNVVEDITKAGGEAKVFGCDVRDLAAVNSMIAEVEKTLGSVDILVFNAIKGFTPTPIENLAWSDYLEELEVSIKGLHHCCQAVIPAMRQKKAGKIITISSIIADSPIPSQSSYITAKNAVVGYTRSLAKELVKDNIQANIVVPNMVETDLLSAIPASFVQKIGRERDFGRNIHPIEVAQSILFLGSRWADTISGEKLVLNLGEDPFL